MSALYSGYYSTIMRDTPLRYYRLGERSGTIVYDSSSSGQNGTINGTVLYNDSSLIQGSLGSMGFVAANAAYISVPTTGLPTGASPWTLEAWIKLFSVPTSGYYEIVSFGSGVTNEAPQLFVHNSQFTCSIWSNGVSGGSAATATIYHIAGRWDGTNLALFLNGQLIASSTSYTPNVGLSWANIGADSNNEDFMDGDIQDVAIYGYALSADQIVHHYHAGLSAGILRG